MKFLLITFLFITTLTANDWLSFRGSQSNIGRANEKISDKPKLAWKFTTGGPIKGTAAVTKEKVFIGSEDNKFYCLNLADGKEVWSIELSDIIESSPLILENDVVIGTADGNLYRLESKTGKILWTYKAEDRFAGGANWFELNGEKVVVAGNYDNFVHAVSFKTGKKVWAYETENFINGTPAVDGDNIVFGGCDNFLYVLGTDGKIKNEIDLGSYIAGSPGMENGQAYIGHYDHKYFRVDVETKKIVWEFSKSTFPFFSSPAIGEKQIIFGGRDRRIYCLNKETGERTWTFKTKGKNDSSPLLSDGKVIFGSSDGRVYILKAEDGKELWQFDVGKAIIAAPAIAHNSIVIGSTDGILYCFK
ncbi:MAG: PQQ-binding-like beta-propeller repeat protein [Lentisphaeraceae bacterium]|nr:PQQ-binding-like beta-propeller repeat protein [Lentisphaeraceae bacterium]